MGTCRIGGLRPFGEAIVGSLRVSDMKVSGVSQQMIDPGKVKLGQQIGSGSVCREREEGEEGNHAHHTLLFRHKCSIQIKQL